MKGKGSPFLYVLGVLMLTVACNSTLDEQSYIKWVQDYENGLHVKKESGDYNFDVQFLPDDYRWLQYKEGERNKGDDLQYFLLTVSPREDGFDLVEYKVQTEEEKQRRLYYLSYTFQSDLVVEENGETFPCVLYHFERPADMKNSRTFLLGFEKSATSSTETKLVISSSLLGSLPVNIKISKEDIPALSI